MTDDDRKHIKACLLAIERLEEFSSAHDVEEAQEDYRVSDVLLMEFENLANSIMRLSLEFLKDNLDIPYNQIKGLRNRIAHDYLSVSLLTLYQTISFDIPKLKCILLKQVDD